MGSNWRNFRKFFFSCCLSHINSQIISCVFSIASQNPSQRSLSVASNWLWNFGIGYATPYVVDPSSTGINAVKAANLGVKVFFIWGGTCVGCFIFT